MPHNIESRSWADLQTSPHSQGARGGFTILELLLASLFGAILMAALWSLLRTYERLFTLGETRTEQAELVRSLLDQLAEDLSSGIADNAASPTGGIAPVRRFGLLGSAQSLQVDVLQVPPLEAIAGPSSESGDASRRARAPRVSELRTIQWRFTDPDRPGAGSRSTGQPKPSWSGLVRRELDWETPASQGPTGRSSSRGIGRLRTKFRFSRGATSSSSSPPSDRFDIDPDDPSILVVPEVVGVKFRYFDGQGFANEWNSLARKSLPMAVEIVLQVRAGKAAEKDERPRTGDASSGASDRPAEVAGDSYRMLVHLPSTSLARRSEASSPSGSPPRAVAVVRERPMPAAPSPPPTGAPRGSVKSDLSDQWMRSGQ